MDDDEDADAVSGTPKRGGVRGHADLLGAFLPHLGLGLGLK
jgi:hypothetical protein